MNDVTRILSAIEQGDPQAAEELLPLVYDELRKLAAQKLAQEKPGPDAPGHRPGPRGVPPAGRTRSRRQRLEQPRPLLRRRGRGHAPHPRRQRPPQARPQARRRPAAHRTRPASALPAEARLDDLLALDEALTRARRGRTRVKRRAGQAPLLRRPDVEEAAACLGISPRHRRALLGLRPRLALRRPGRRRAGGPQRILAQCVMPFRPDLALTRETDLAAGADHGRRRDPELTMPSSAPPSRSQRRRSGPLTSTGLRRDAALRRRVETLLEAHDQAGSFLERPAARPSTHR